MGSNSEEEEEEEERLVQMVHDFIESESPPSPASPPLNQELTHLLLEDILGRCTDVEMKVLDKAMKYVREMGDDERKRCSVKKRLMMRLRMDGFDASLCRSSWVATFDCPAGDYEYIVIEEEGGGMTKRIIVDIDFKSQFEVARPTSSYKKLSSSLPSFFVGNDEKLKKMVSLLCSAAQQSLRESGLHIPPWRTSRYMHSKWLPCFHKASAVPNLALALPQHKAWLFSGHPLF